MTNERERPIRQYFWSPDSRRVLFIQDKGGDENFLLYGVDVATGKQVTLTPFKKTRAEIVGASNIHKDRILVGLNNRDAKWHDVYSLNLNTGKLTLVQRNDGYAGFLADNDLKLRMALKSRDDGGTDYYRDRQRQDRGQALRHRGPRGFADHQPRRLHRRRQDPLLDRQPRPEHRRADRPGRRDRQHDGARREPQSGHQRHARAIRRPREIEAYRAEYLKPEWSALDKDIGASLEWLEVQARRLARGPGADRRRRQVDRQRRPRGRARRRVYLFDRKAGSLTKLYTGRPELIGAPLVPMWPVEIKSRDGLTLPSYLTLPAGADANHDGRPDHPVPLVLYVHGGPWGRDSYGYSSHAINGSPTAAMPCSRSISAASTGFGKDFIYAGNLQWGRKMHDDLIDSVDWAIANGVDHARQGRDHGRQLRRLCDARRPHLHSGQVRLRGRHRRPVEPVHLAPDDPALLGVDRQQFYKRMGNPTTPRTAAPCSRRPRPLTYVDRIQRPLLIGQGANDPRVNKREADQIVDAMKAKNIPVTYALFPDEGHGFARPQNNIAFNAVAENFLADLPRRPRRADRRCAEGLDHRGVERRRFRQRIEALARRKMSRGA